MAIENFIPTIWNEAINRDLERHCVFAEDCNRQYEGDVKEKGDTVRILGIGKPTIKTLARASADGDIDGPETVEDSSVNLVIDQIRYFNYMVGKIDKKQAVGGVMDALSKETSEGLANEVDKYIANFATDESIEKLYGTTPQKVVVNDSQASGEKHVLDVLDSAILWMREHDIPATTEIVLDASPRFVSLLRKAYIIRDTNNSEMILHGKVGMYGNVTIKESNNVAKSGGVDNIMMRTKRAIAYAQPMTFTKAYEPEKKFVDAVKGFILFGGKIVRPREMLNINVKYE